MPIYEYRVKDGYGGCTYCVGGFESLRKLSDEPLTECPECSDPVEKQISSHSVGGSKSGFDDRAKAAGFQKFEKLGKGEYEKKY